jgi:hypothetical protein
MSKVLRNYPFDNFTPRPQIIFGKPITLFWLKVKVSHVIKFEANKKSRHDTINSEIDALASLRNVCTEQSMLNQINAQISLCAQEWLSIDQAIESPNMPFMTPNVLNNVNFDGVMHASLGITVILFGNEQEINNATKVILESDSDSGSIAFDC